MSLQRWHIVDSEQLLDARIFQVHRVRERLGHGGGEHDFFVLGGTDWCNIIPLTDAGEVVMVRQFRHGTREVTLEVPGGLVDPQDASPLEAARRELLEETGYAADRVEPLGVIDPNPAFLRQRCHTMVGRGARRVSSPHPDEREELEVVLVPVSDIPAAIADRSIAHALTVVAFTWLFGLGGPR